MSINLYFKQVSRSRDSPSNINSVKVLGAVFYISGHLVHFEPCLGKQRCRGPRPGAETLGREGGEWVETAEQVPGSDTTPS